MVYGVKRWRGPTGPHPLFKMTISIDDITNGSNPVVADIDDLRRVIEREEALRKATYPPIIKRKVADYSTDGWCRGSE